MNNILYWLESRESLAYMFEEGEGVEKNDQEAARLYALAVAQGNAVAQNNLGLMYELGRSVEKNDQEAARLYALAAAQGDAHAQTNLGLMYELGKGVKNEQEAMRLFGLAAAQHNEIAQKHLQNLQEAGNKPDEEDKPDPNRLIINQLSTIITQINENIRGKDSEGNKIKTSHWTHDTSGDKIRVLEGLESLLKNPSVFKNEEVNEALIKNILDVCQGLYEVKRHRFGFFPDSAQEFHELLKPVLEGTTLTIPEHPRTFSTENLKSLLKDGKVEANLLQLIHGPDYELSSGTAPDL